MFIGRMRLHAGGRLAAIVEQGRQVTRGRPFGKFADVVGGLATGGATGNHTRRLSSAGAGIYAMLPSKRQAPHRMRVLMDFPAAGMA